MYKRANDEKNKFKEKRTQIFVWRIKLKIKITPAEKKKDQVERNKDLD